ncbi:MAG: M20/M25/M40 family metallo-hydrolase [candidate division Zixibacteria bacterium]|nr:M20/M25/M40 family metallo-hydrolase [candidate division Zixibacteria bacterium]
MGLDAVGLTRDMVDIKSVSRWNNVAISEYVESWMKAKGFDVEWLEYTDENGERKVSLVGKKGEGAGGVGFFSHTDTVPGQEEDWDPYRSEVKEGRLYGRGSCDMKGPLAATMIAAAAVDASRLKKAVIVAATADEELGGAGAQQVTDESRLMNEALPAYGIVAEPTMLTPVYAHKGGATITVTANGHAAHTSTDLGVSANFLIAPFLAEIAAMAKPIKTDPRYMNHEFNPPSNGFNMVINDYGTRSNVFAARSTAIIGFRPMPGDHSEALLEEIAQRAKNYGFDVKTHINQGYRITPDAPVIQLASRLTGDRKPETVPYGTDALRFAQKIPCVVFGPGSITQAHTVGEYIDVSQLQQAVDVYTRMIETVCM